MVPFFYMYADVVQHAATSLLGSAFDSAQESKLVSRTMAFNHDAFQAQQAGAVVTAAINPALEGIED
jgi:hypothetical protein